MNKKGAGLVLAIALATILLILFFILLTGSLSYGKIYVAKQVKIDADKLEVKELLLEILETEDGNLNVADLIILGEFDKVENVLNERLEDFSFKVYKDFKNIVQSKPIYSLGKVEGVSALQNIKNYLGDDLVVYLSVK